MMFSNECKMKQEVEWRGDDDYQEGYFYAWDLHYHVQDHVGGMVKMIDKMDLWLLFEVTFQNLLNQEKLRKLFIKENSMWIILGYIW